MHEVKYSLVMTALIMWLSSYRNQSTVVASFVPHFFSVCSESNYQCYQRSRTANIRRRKYRTFQSKLYQSSAASKEHKTLAINEDNNGKVYYQEEIVIKKSRFIGIATRCESWSEAQLSLEKIRKEHPKSRHICFGLCCGVNPCTERASDDGEPTGTAAAPILGAINGIGLSDTLCVVVRYSGGIKLGAGGLIRAYGGAARLVLQGAPHEVLIPKSNVRVLVHNVANAGGVYDAINKIGGTGYNEIYNADGSFEIAILCETAYMDGLLDNLRDVTRGQIEILASPVSDDSNRS